MDIQTTLTDEEEAALVKLADAWNAFFFLLENTKDDVDAFRHGIHVLQHIIMARPTSRYLHAKRTGKM